MTDLLTLLFLGLATSSTSVTISKTAITEKFRTWLWTFPKIKSIAYLFSCPYCISHWIAFVLVGALVPWEGVLPYLVYCGVVIAIAAIVTGMMFKLLLWDQAEIDELRLQLNQAKEVLKEIAGD